MQAVKMHVRVEAPVQSISKDDMAYQSESVDSEVDSHKLNPSEANLKTSERKKTKEIYIKYNATNKNFVNA